MDSGEQALIEAAQKNPADFAPLYDANFEGVYAYALRRLGNRAAAEDVTAEVFRSALASIGSFEWRGVPFVAWLYRIAANEIADNRKKASREESMEIAEEGREDELERRAMLFGLVGKLPLDQRRVVVMRFAEEKSIREVAEALGRSEGAVKQLQFRALQTLRERMGTIHG